jgi:hypothetical protein
VRSRTVSRGCAYFVGDLTEDGLRTPLILPILSGVFPYVFAPIIGNVIGASRWKIESRGVHEQTEFSSSRFFGYRTARAVADRDDCQRTR